MSSLHTVHVRVNDGAGKPTPVRIRFVGADGTYYAPFGRLAEPLMLSGEGIGGNLLSGVGKEDCDRGQWAYIDGSCEIALPADPVDVEIHKGPEYKPIKQRVTLGPGKMALRFPIERWTDLRQERWYSGDVHAHFLSPHAALLEGAAEDLTVVNLLAWELLRREAAPPYNIIGKTIPNITEFSGQEPSVQRSGHMVVVGTLNHGGHLGSLALLNCHRIVFPLRTGSDEIGIDWTLADWCDQCHRKRGLVVWTQFGLTWGDPEAGFSGETLANLLLGKIDAIEIDSLDGPRNRLTDEWYRLLNCGLKVTIVGGSGKINNVIALGAVRTYARLPEGEEFSYKNWIEAIRAGRTFITNGPLLSFTVNGLDSGSTINLSADQRTVTVRAEASSQVPFDRLELIANGAAVAGVEATVDASGSPYSAKLEGTFEVPASGWLAARCWGEAKVYTRGVPEQSSAHTSPVYVNIAEQPFVPDAISIALLGERLESMLHWAEHGAKFKSDKTRQDLLATFQTARAELARRALPLSGTPPAG
jgi:hypothetical protein